MTGTFYKLPKTLAARRDLSPIDKLIYAVIADRIGANDHCWPGVRRLAADVGCHRATVSQAVGRLEAAGLVTVEHGCLGRTNRYRLVSGETAGSAVPSGRHRRHGPAGMSEGPVAPPGRARPESATQTRQTQEKTKTHKTKRADASDPFQGTPLPEGLDTPDFRAAWDEWVAYRREIRKALTPTAIRRHLATLAAHGPDTAAAMIGQSIERAWVGLFPVKGDRRRRPPQEDLGAALGTRPLTMEEADALDAACGER